MTVRLGWLCIFAGAFLLGSTLVHAGTRALVVGVSGYPNLPEAIHLDGPKNDAREVANTLVRLGVPAGDVTVLADGVSGLRSAFRSRVRAQGRRFWLASIISPIRRAAAIS
jgi:hypothetical protein